MTDEMLTKYLEITEAEQNLDLRRAAPEEVRHTLGMREVRIGGGVVMAMANDPSGYWNRSLGFGFGSPVTAGLLDAVSDFYRESGATSGMIQIAPAAIPDDWDALREKAGLVEHSSWVKMVADVDVAVKRSPDRIEDVTDLRVGRVHEEDADEWGRLMTRVFGMRAEGLSQMMSSTVGRPRWQGFGAWDGDRLVATGMMYVHGGIARFLSGTTSEEARGRGGHSALLVARARAAQAARCRFLVAETRPETAGGQNSSLHNMQRLGFNIRYERKNWAWRFDGENG
ncbi:GNAT family N-acetyltransferase [Streptomyces sp. Lzd4kr]|nr:GNAT family N-acetyltransferase [Streptomyces sp. Lzd4kr]